MSKHYPEVKKTLLLVLFLNLLVSFSKMIVALCINSASLLGDGFHSLGDGLSNVIGLMGIKIAEKPQDKDHPYGHKKFENLASLGIATLLFVLGINLFYSNSINFFDYKKIIITPHVLIFMIISLCINIFVVWYEKTKGKEYKSDILIADSQHTKSDVLITISVLIGLVLTHRGYFLADKIIAIGVSILIFKAGYEIALEGIQVLSDTMVLEPETIKNTIYENFKEVKDCYKIRTHGRKDDIHVDLHIKVNPKLNVKETHDLSHKIDKCLKQNFCGIKHTFIHVEPLEQEKEI